MGTEKAMSPAELQEREKEAERALMALVGSYLLYPVPHNRRMVEDAMHNYQLAWMNGRKRPEVAP